ncbi:hypothetical protein BGZ47_010147 [Haplosporangium gracile]|nr:hypothetical protein BGZ47_010147 [Haplosporangium gracile]
MSPPELIIYLEPTFGSTLHTQLLSYFSATTQTAFAENEATRYPPHTTMVGFFNTPASPIHSTTVPAILEYIDAWHIRLHTLSTTTQDQPTPTADTRTVVTGCYRPKPDLLLIGLTPSPHLIYLLQSLSKAFPDLGLRLKQINHLSLCYWDDGNINPTAVPETLLAQRVEFTNQATWLAQEKIPMVDIPAGTTVENEGWDVVIYSIEGRSKASGLPYSLQEIKRWTLPSFV